MKTTPEQRNKLRACFIRGEAFDIACVAVLDDLDEAEAERVSIAAVLRLPIEEGRVSASILTGVEFLRDRYDEAMDELVTLRRVGAQMQSALIIARDAMRAWATGCEDPETIENSNEEIDQACAALAAYDTTVRKDADHG